VGSGIDKVEPNRSERFGEIIFSNFSLLRVSSSLDALALNCSFIDFFLASLLYEFGLPSSDTAILLFFVADKNIATFCSTNG